MCNLPFLPCTENVLWTPVTTSVVMASSFPLRIASLTAVILCAVCCPFKTYKNCLFLHGAQWSVQVTTHWQSILPSHPQFVHMRPFASCTYMKSSHLTMNTRINVKFNIWMLCLYGEKTWATSRPQPHHSSRIILLQSSSSFFEDMTIHHHHHHHIIHKYFIVVKVTTCMLLYQGLLTPLLKWDIPRVHPFASPIWNKPL